MTNQAKLYAWEPSGHGEHSVIVAAMSEEEAKAAADKYVAEFLQRFPDYSIHFDGWNTGYYTLTVYDMGEVMVHEND